jgi:hypothetical protein
LDAFFVLRSQVRPVPAVTWGEDPIFMPHVILPAEHSDADLVLATQVAEAVDSAELFVAWTRDSGRATPEVEAVLREPLPPVAMGFALLLEGLAELWRAVVRRDSAPRTR